MLKIADITVDILTHTQPTINAKTGQPSKALSKTDVSILEKAKANVAELLQRYPLYPEIIID
jgi:glycine hydroxymethyltransferase